MSELTKETLTAALKQLTDANSEYFSHDNFGVFLGESCIDSDIWKDHDISEIAKGLLRLINKDNWIPIDDKRHLENGVFLIQTKNRSVTCADSVKSENDSWEFHNGNIIWSEDEINYYQPLPEAKT